MRRANAANSAVSVTRPARLGVKAPLTLYGRRVGDGDVEALPELLALSAEIDAAIAKSVTGLRAAGYSWADIASRLGTTRQAAQQRFGRTSDNA
ncbi:MAG: hypothetical protein HYZ39_16285 [Mycolicibacterium cosmeticum]|nr:hypothetical protein [Mycolicibacterium cosmeticum]